jgi:hypothetical protein
MNQKFVLDKTPVTSPRKPIFDSTSSRPNSHQQQERNFEIENIGQMMAEGHLPTEEENRSVADRSNLSTPSGRSSTISVDLNFKKDSKIVKTINDVDDGEIGGDQHQQLENHPPKIDEVHEKEGTSVFFTYDVLDPYLIFHFRSESQERASSTKISCSYYKSHGIETENASTIERTIRFKRSTCWKHSWR